MEPAIEEPMNATFAEDEASDLDDVIGGQADNPPRLLIHGCEKIGKSSFGASAPGAIFLPTEDGLDRIDCKKFPIVANWPTFLARLKQVRNARHNYATLVIDSMDWLEKLIWRYLCEQSKVESIELACGSYGKGYTRAAEMFYELLKEHLDPIRRERNMAIILIAHSKVEKVEEPGIQAYDRSSPRLDKRAMPIVCEWSDAIGFACKRVRVDEDKAAKGARNIPHAIGSDRYLVLSDSKPACLAGNRYGITEDLPLSWDAFAAAAFKQNV